MHRVISGLLLALGLSAVLPEAHAQRVDPNPRNVAAIAEGQAAIVAYEQQLAQVRREIGDVEAGAREANAHKVLAAWLEGEIALASQSFTDAHPKAQPIVEAKAAEARAAHAAAIAWKDRQRTDLSAFLSNTPIDKRSEARPLLEAILAAEGSLANVATQLATDFDNVLKSLGEGTEPYALFNARKQMNEQASAVYTKATADILDARTKLKALLPDLPGLP